jgi:predicted nucleotidyltransferase
MGSAGFTKLQERWRNERESRAHRSGEMWRRLIERGIPVLRAHGVRQAWLFGSVAAGTAEPGSDIDLLVSSVDAEDYWVLRRELEAAIGCPLDLYTQNDDPVLVRKVIERGELIYAVPRRVVERGCR